MWIILALLSALAESIKDTLGKMSVTKMDEYTAALALHLFTLLITLPLVFFTGIPNLTAPFWWGSLAFIFVTPLWSISYMKALKLSPLSEVLPMMAFNPMFTAALAFIFLKKGIDEIGWTGIGLISAGMYMVYLKPEIIKRGVLAPIKGIISNRGARHMLWVAFLWSVGAYLSKWRVEGSSPIFSTMTSGLIGVISTYILSMLVRKPIKIWQFVTNATRLWPIGLFYYLANISSSYALLNGPTAYVFAIKRGSIIASALTGKWFFKEDIYLAKVVGLVMIGVGILMLMI